MSSIPIPMERLRFFRKELQVDADFLAPLEPYRQRFIDSAPEMAEKLFASVSHLTTTKIVLEHETTPSRLQNNWQRWYKAMWRNPLDDRFLRDVWNSGYNHVSHGVDHRFVNIAYLQARGYMHGLIQEMAPSSEEAHALHDIVDRLVDLCLLVETEAFLEAKSTCSNEIMMGIAHQLRNPLTIIGGFATRLVKKVPEGFEHDAAETILEEANRVEQMVTDVRDYIAVLQSDPLFTQVDLNHLLEETLAELADELPAQATVEPISGEAQADADPALLAMLFRHLLKNAVEALPGEAPGKLRICLSQAPESAHFVRVEIFNSGETFKAEETDDFFKPFHSSKPHGTGIGLSLALLAARKNFGTLTLNPGHLGVTATTVLPAAGAVHESGLFFGK